MLLKQKVDRARAVQHRVRLEYKPVYQSINLLRHVGLAGKATAVAWHADPIKTIKTFFSYQMGCTLIEVP